MGASGPLGHILPVYGWRAVTRVHSKQIVIVLTYLYTVRFTGSTRGIDNSEFMINNIDSQPSSLIGFSFQPLDTFQGNLIELRRRQVPSRHWKISERGMFVLGVRTLAGAFCHHRICGMMYTHSRSLPLLNRISHGILVPTSEIVTCRRGYSVLIMSDRRS